MDDEVMDVDRCILHRVFPLEIAVSSRPWPDVCAELASSATSHDVKILWLDVAGIIYTDKDE